MGKAPAPVDGLGYCPLVGQGCIGEACAFWVKMYGIDDEGKPQLDEDCTFNWSTLLQREVLVETARVSAGNDKVANETNKLGTMIAVGIESSRHDG